LLPAERTSALDIPGKEKNQSRKAVGNTILVLVPTLPSVFPKRNLSSHGRNAGATSYLTAARGGDLGWGKGKPGNYSGSQGRETLVQIKNTLKTLILKNTTLSTSTQLPARLH
jgi:hypothetical protein